MEGGGVGRVFKLLLSDKHFNSVVCPRLPDDTESAWVLYKILTK